LFGYAPLADRLFVGKTRKTLCINHHLSRQYCGMSWRYYQSHQQQPSWSYSG
jgi:hypothetical protein